MIHRVTPFLRVMVLHSDILCFSAVVHPPLPFVHPSTHSCVHPHVHLSIIHPFVQLCNSVSIHPSCFPPLYRVTDTYFSAYFDVLYLTRISFVDVGVSVGTPRSCTIVLIYDGYQLPSNATHYTCHLISMIITEAIA